MEMRAEKMAPPDFELRDAGTRQRALSFHVG